MSGWLLDLTHTAHTAARTGIQRVCRELAAAWADEPTVWRVTYDPFARTWRRLNVREEARLQAPTPQAGMRRKGNLWDARTKWAGRVDSIGRKGPHVSLPREADAKGLIVGELFEAIRGRRLAALARRVRGPRVAIFHDAVALRFPHHAPAATVARFPLYLHQLRGFDGIAANSAATRDELLAYWRWAGGTHPPVAAVPLAAAQEAPAAPPEPAPWRDEPTILMVGTLEGRKNHVALLEACAQLWDAGARFRLELIGGLQRQTGQAAADRIAQLQAAGRPLVWHEGASDADLDAAYTRASFTAYVSVAEGFGLPVDESLRHGRACVCTPVPALLERAAEGGCLVADGMDAPAVAAALKQLLHDRTLFAKLTAEACARPVRLWGDYARALQEFAATLSRRDDALDLLAS